nr:vacuolar fusion protein CCZ1 homolog [Leptinotarsa decemlineata]
MVTQNISGLKNFFIFNPTLSTKEGEELQKILYYYPICDNTEVQIKNVGLVEGIIQFTDTFKPTSSASSLHTNKTRQLYFQPEKNYWMVMTLRLNQISKERNATGDAEELEDDIQDNVYEAMLKQAYYMYRLFWGTFQSVKDLSTLKMNIEIFYRTYLQSLKLPQADILNVFCGIQYLPLDKQTFLKVQCFVNLLESTFPIVPHTAFFYNEHLIWSGVEPSDMQVIYQYLSTSVFPANLETETQGSSRNSSSTLSALQRGRFIIGPSNLKLAKTVGKIPKVYLFGGSGTSELYFVIYKMSGASVCLFIKGDYELTVDCFKELNEFMNFNLVSVVSSITEYSSREVVTPCSETSPRFIYFNKLNLALKSTVHSDIKPSAAIKDSVKIIADINSLIPFLGSTGESIVKTMNDYWVIGKTSNSREFYIALQQKNASLIDISEEVSKLCETELKGIFFHSA